MTLDTELRHFDSIKADLLRHHAGKYALIIGSELLGVFDQREEAYKVGVDGRGNVPMLIKRIAPEDGVETVPAMTLGLLGADL
jgi:hypothetical protein